MQEAALSIQYIPVPSNIEDLTGRVFGKLTVLGLIRVPKVNSYWLCQCFCGKIREFHALDLLRKNNQSCGCLRERHGNTKGRKSSLEYSSWRSMWARCSNSRSSEYPYYGGRGIQVCSRWTLFSTFLADMGQRPSRKHSIDRIDVNGNYCPENCRWATSKEQCRNRRNSRYIEAFGKRQTLVEWSEVSGIKETTIAERIKRGWTIEDSVTKKTR